MSVVSDPDVCDIKDHPEGYKGVLTKGAIQNLFCYFLAFQEFYLIQNDRKMNELNNLITLEPFNIRTV